MIVEIKEKCCGCGACALCCPHKAIKMVIDKEGFKYPKINQKLCTHCGLCHNLCPSKKDTGHAPLTTYVGRHTNLSEVKKSRSGAAFVLLSDWILQQNGIIYGVITDSALDNYYIRACNQQQRDAMRGSKYVMADLKNVYKEVKEDLRKGMLVLFSGTPCHVAGLKAYLGDTVNSDTLYLVDIFCHAASSPKIYRMYLNSMTNLFRKPITEFVFRDKSRVGWSAHEEMLFAGKKRYSHLYKDIFYSMLFIRPSCYQCKYRTAKREGDISIGDAWGKRQIFHDNVGASIIECNTPKGIELLEKVKGKLNGRQVDSTDFAQFANSDEKIILRNREEVWSCLRKHGFLFTVIRFVELPRILERFCFKARK